MAFTIDQLDQKIREAQNRLDYWKGLREMVSNPLFKELEPSPNGHVLLASEPRPVRGGITPPPLSAPEYGAIRRLTLEALPTEGSGITTNELARILTEKGYVFRSKWPTISVNDALRTLEGQGLAKIAGKNSSNGFLWLRGAESGVSAESSS